MKYLIRKPELNEASAMLFQAATGATAMNVDQPLPTPVLVKILHDKDVPGDGSVDGLVYAEVEPLPDGTSLEEALFRATETGGSDPQTWEVFVAALVPVDSVEGKAFADAQSQQSQQS